MVVRNRKILNTAAAYCQEQTVLERVTIPSVEIQAAVIGSSYWHETWEFNFIYLIQNALWLHCLEYMGNRVAEILVHTHISVV